ncbi:TetR/AcrR family transcriptional regulator [Umezawaea sp. Da 62-37]|uniref:TetR/AcrR family transcriptional regulator n=1 Tax=Umezawaea sp. Da 62-37 TaxID=3075927 RepID=UPI0028F6ECE6|nr:TetR/AcrR family transcriptional regulator [Umezawaea sp. Da 62-37]WNV91337.1 TetR/AcrR family transcriptional regulator [Umezawaea sp. Da 62-37]
MARPKTITDERLLDATAVLVGRKGPGFTLAEVAAEAGVSVGTIAQRFGSKSGLLQEVSRTATRIAVARMRAAATAAVDPADGLRAALLTLFGELADPEVAANSLAQLGVDLVDPSLRALLVEHFTAVEDELRDLVRAAALPGAPDPALAARVLAGLVNGISMDWSIRPRGAFADRIAEDVDSVLGMWRKA